MYTLSNNTFTCIAGKVLHLFERRNSCPNRRIIHGNKSLADGQNALISSMIRLIVGYSDA